MNDGPRKSRSTIPADSVERLIAEQLRIMEKQLRILRSLQVPDDRGADEGADETASSPPTVASADTPATGVDPTIVPLTDAQRDVWIISQLSAHGSAAYNLAATLELTGVLDVEMLQEALRQVVQRHEALRTTFDATGDHQIVHHDVDTRLAVLDISDGPHAEQRTKVAAFVDSELTSPYDLGAGPLFRATLLRLEDAQHTLVLSGHHLIWDGWSFGVLLRDLGVIYSSLAGSSGAPLSDATQFSDFAAWRVDRSTESEPYWLDLYQSGPRELDLPADKSRPPTRAFEYGTERLTIDAELLMALKELAVTHGVTPFIVLLAAWEILLHRLSGQQDFTSGVFVSGQASMGARSLVGLCTNLLALPVRIAPDEPIAEYLRRLQQSTFDAFDNQHYSVGNLASALQLPRDASRPTLVSTVITYETPTEGIGFEGLEAVESSLGRRVYGSFEFEAYIAETRDDLAVDFQYSSALFEPETIRRWLSCYRYLLEQMSTRAADPVATLQLLEDAERNELLTRWNDTRAAVPGDSTHERFEAQATHVPGHVAVRTSQQSLTYAELNAQANRLARHLQGLGVGPDRLVGVNLHRSPEMLVALLAVHKAGGAYVPLDPLFPDERLAMIAEDAGLHVLLTQRSLLGTVLAEGATEVVLDRDLGQAEPGDDMDLGIPIDPASLAYVIYTSGSTGRPKGVEIPHVALTNFLESMRLRPGLDAEDVLLAVTTMSFDIAGLELFLPLTVGATVVLAEEHEAVDAVWLRERLGAGDITVMQATPATWQLLVDAGWAGTNGLKVLCGGEALSPELAASLSSKVDSLWNMYGPTETTIWSSVSQVDGAGGPITIGQPIANTELHVLDAALEPQPLGIPGELYIGGIGLARGYRDRDELTAERFVTHQFHDQPPGRLYRTGDMVRRFADGRIEYLGRADFQVKIRGYRIELGEIETTLTGHPDVKECVVAARDGDDGSKRLVAYIVPSGDRPSDVSTLRAFLRETLPDYMVPAIFVVLDAFPLTANNKVDRARLPEPDGQRPDLSTELVPPRTEAEIILAGIWQSYLDLEQIGIQDNFFDLGGDSLSALRVVMEANRQGISLQPNSIFRFQTIAELAHASGDAAGASDDEQGIVTGATPLTPAQLRFLDERRSPDSHHWNLSSLVEAEHLSVDALGTAVAALISHHDALRLRLWREDGRWKQEIAAPSDEVPFESHDLSTLTPEDRVAAIERICTKLQGSFDLAKGVLVRAAHFDGGPDDVDRLFVTIHHFGVDGMTWAVVWEDLEQAYLQALAGEDIGLPPKTSSIRSWATQLELLAESARVSATASVWLAKPWSEVARLPMDSQAGVGANTNASAEVVIVELSEDDTRQLLAREERADHVIITALARCLSEWTSSPTVLVDILSHGRDTAIGDLNLSRTVGFTLSYNPLVLTHPTWQPSLDTVASVASQIDEGPDGYTFELLRFKSSDEGLRDRLTRLPRAELLFNFAGVRTDDIDIATWREVVARIGPDESPHGLRQHPIAVRATFEPNLRLTFVYSRELHVAETIDARAANVVDAIRGLVSEPVGTR